MTLGDKNSDRDEKAKWITKTLMSRGKEYALKLTYKDHQQFLTYWFNTQNKKEYAAANKGGDTNQKTTTTK